MLVGELPAGWEAVPTPEGDCYYWNRETGATTWELPALSLAPKVIGNAEGASTQCMMTHRI